MTPVALLPNDISSASCPPKRSRESSKLSNPRGGRGDRFLSLGRKEDAFPWHRNPVPSEDCANRFLIALYAGTNSAAHVRISIGNAEVESCIPKIARCARLANAASHRFRWPVDRFPSRRKQKAITNLRLTSTSPNSTWRSFYSESQQLHFVFEKNSNSSRTFISRSSRARSHLVRSHRRD